MNTLRDAGHDGQLEPAAYLETAGAPPRRGERPRPSEGVLTFAHTQVADRLRTPAELPAALTLSPPCARTCSAAPRTAAAPACASPPSATLIDASPVRRRHPRLV
ncbi:hypothetical protein [Streptomyces sp. KL116D]|uniref:hypothetical protein n=1 Tax=Streptomyces sp. KL116D TaxID=3045152 RepID=UPI00355642C7